MTLTRGGGFAPGEGFGFAFDVDFAVGVGLAFDFGAGALPAGRPGRDPGRAVRDRGGRGRSGGVMILRVSVGGVAGQRLVVIG